MTSTKNQLDALVTTTTKELFYGVDQHKEEEGLGLRSPDHNR